MSYEVKAAAVVNVTLHIPAKSTWGGSTGIDQIHKQAKEDAINAVRKAVGPTIFQILGDVSVERIVLTEDKRNY